VDHHRSPELNEKIRSTRTRAQKTETSDNLLKSYHNIITLHT